MAPRYREVYYYEAVGSMINDYCECEAGHDETIDFTYAK